MKRKSEYPLIDTQIKLFLWALIFTILSICLL